MTKKEWYDWLKCNILEIIILILVIVLLVKVYSAPAVENIPAITAVAVGEPLTEEPVSVAETPTETLPSPEATEETPVLPPTE